MTEYFWFGYFVLSIVLGLGLAIAWDDSGGPYGLNYEPGEFLFNTICVSVMWPLMLTVLVGILIFLAVTNHGDKP